MSEQDRIKELMQCLKLDDGPYSGDDILKLIKRGEKYLGALTGTSPDFINDETAHSLLLNWCRYEINNSLEYFKHNFSSEILLLQLQEGIRVMEDD